MKSSDSALGSIKNFDYTVLFCGDLARTIAFYRDVMGFPIERERKNWVNFRLGSSILALRTRAVENEVEDSRHEHEAESVQLAFRVPPSKLEDCYRELVHQHVPIVSPPRELPSWGHRMFLFRDPEGNLLEIYADI